MSGRRLLPVPTDGQGRTSALLRAHTPNTDARSAQLAGRPLDPSFELGIEAHQIEGVMSVSVKVLHSGHRSVNADENEGE